MSSATTTATASIECSVFARAGWPHAHATLSLTAGTGSGAWSDRNPCHMRSNQVVSPACTVTVTTDRSQSSRSVNPGRVDIHNAGNANVTNRVALLIND